MNKLIGIRKISIANIKNYIIKTINKEIKLIATIVTGVLDVFNLKWQL